MRRKDLSNRNSLYYMELMDSFQLMDTKVMDRIMKEYWKSNIDTSGSFFQTSTSLKLLKADYRENEDVELSSRFYHARDVSEYTSHPYTLRVYLKSMQTRYFIELALFLMLAVLFQKMIGDFQGNFTDLNVEYDNLLQMRTNSTVTPEEVTQQRKVTKAIMFNTASRLERAMYVSLICFGFPIKTLMTIVYAHKTATEYKLKIEDLFDIFICCLIGYWIGIYVTYSHHQSTNTTVAVTRPEIFMYDILVARKNNVFHFEVLVAVVASTFWLRMFLMLKLTKTFGPLIKIIYAMIRELMIFLVLWGIQLFIFTCVGILVFAGVPHYDGFMQVLILFFQSALGIWDFSIYDNFYLGPQFGQGFHLVFILLNMVLLVNLIIAILSETYQRLSYQKLGLYYDGVIEVIPAYKYKKFYGALIAACPPFNLLVLPFLPFFAFTQNKGKVRRLNNVLVKVIFFPFALIYATLFALVNLLLTPLAYVVTTYRKAKLMLVGSLAQQRHELAMNFVFFLLLGLPILAVTQIVDIYYFVS